MNHFLTFLMDYIKLMGQYDRIQIFIRIGFWCLCLYWFNQAYKSSHFSQFPFQYHVITFPFNIMLSLSLSISCYHFLFTAFIFFVLYFYFYFYFYFHINLSLYFLFTFLSIFFFVFFIYYFSSEAGEYFDEDLAEYMTHLLPK